jgi:hypothetical protein
VTDTDKKISPLGMALIAMEAALEFIETGHEKQAADVLNRALDALLRAGLKGLDPESKRLERWLAEEAAKEDEAPEGTPV